MGMTQVHSDDPLIQGNTSEFIIHLSISLLHNLVVKRGKKLIDERFYIQTELQNVKLL